MTEKDDPSSPENLEDTTLEIFSNLRIQNSPLSGAIVKLNVGGKFFQTSKSTLTKYDGMFRAMFETSIPLATDDTGAVFIDRDPFHFRYILNYMRDGFVEFPDSTKEIREIQNEAQHYLLDGLVALCLTEIEQIEGEEENPQIDDDDDDKEEYEESEDETLRLSDDFTMIQNDAELFRVIADAETPTIIIYYLIDKRGAFRTPEGFYVSSLVDSYKDRAEICFKSFTNTEVTASSLGTPSACWYWSFHFRGGYRLEYPKYNRNGEMMHKQSFLTQLGNSFAQTLRDWGL